MTSPYAITIVPPAEWDALVESMPQRSVYHTRAWIDALRDEHRAAPILVRCARGDEVQAIWPCLTLRKGPLRILGSPLPGWSTAYLGPLFAPRAEPVAALGAMLESDAVPRWAYCSCKVLDHAGAVDLAPLGFTRVLGEETYLLDLEPGEDALWSNLKGQCRSRVRKAARAGLEVVEESGDEWIGEFWAMTVETFGQDGIAPPFTRSFLERVHAALAPAGRILVLTARLDGARVASLVLPHDDRTMYYWAGARFLAHREIPAHNLLHWEAIRRARQRGLAHYDFINVVGSHGRFKKTFGPRIVSMGARWEKSSSPFVALLKRGYERLARWRMRAA